MTCAHEPWTCFYEDRVGRRLAYCTRCHRFGTWQWTYRSAELALELFPADHDRPRYTGEAEVFTRRT